MIAPLPWNEPQRLFALQSYQILDTPSEATFDVLAEQVAATLNAPIAVIGFIDETRHWFKAKVGTPFEVNRREWATCAHTIAEAQVIACNDVRLDARFSDMPPLEQVGVKAYAGAPIIADGCAIGTVCIFDLKTRQFTQEDMDNLERFAKLALGMLEQRRTSIESEGIEILSAALPASQPSQAVQHNILEQIRNKPKVASLAEIQQIGHQTYRLTIHSEKPDSMHWQIWAMSPTDTTPRAMQRISSNQSDFLVAEDTRAIVVSLEPQQPTTHPTQVIAVLPIAPT